MSHTKEKYRVVILKETQKATFERIIEKRNDESYDDFVQRVQEAVQNIKNRSCERI